VTRSRKESPRLSCESAAEKIPLATRREGTHARARPGRIFGLNDRWLMFASRAAAPGFASTTTVALATGRAYNGPLCFSRMIGIKGGRGAAVNPPGTPYSAERICTPRAGGVAAEMSKKEELIDGPLRSFSFFSRAFDNFRRASSPPPSPLSPLWFIFPEIEPQPLVRSAERASRPSSQGWISRTPACPLIDSASCTLPDKLAIHRNQ